MYEFWKINDKVIFRGYTRSYLSTNASDVVIPDTFNGEPVTVVDSYCFMKCKIIESVVIPASIEKVEVEAFINCKNLKKVTFLNKNTVVDKTAFTRCNNLEEIDFFVYKILSPDQLCKILAPKIPFWDTLCKDEQDAIVFCFKRKPNLRKAFYLSDNPVFVSFILSLEFKLEIDDFDQHIQRNIELENTQITALYLDKKNSTFTKQEIEEFNEYRDLVEIGFSVPDKKMFKQKWHAKFTTDFLGNDETIITGYNGKNTSEILTSDTIKAYNITEIGCGKQSYFPLTNFVIEDGVTTIMAYAFYFSSLVYITLPSTLTLIDSSGFQRSLSLKRMEIPNSVYRIGYRTFEECTSLEEVILSEKLTNITPYCFAHCTSLKSVIIPDLVVKIGKYSFQDCTALEEVVFGKSVEFIEHHAFSECHNLKKIVFSENLSSISLEVFAECSSLEEIVFPKSLKRIDSSAFIGCNRLKKVVFMGDVDVDKNAFLNLSNIEFVYNS